MAEDLLARESAKRRAFAIISHPDAGKTTLTEKLLLYGGAVQLAGSVTSRRKERATTSDWMELERQRGISVNSTVLQFEYGGFHLNLLDTPGHKDFSEDTFRVLTAVDSAVMVLDAAKGIESQTLKLFEICRERRIPIFTFVNKLDRPTLEPLELLDSLENRLQLHPYPMNWPLGSGAGFRGLYERESRRLHLFERVPGGSYRAPVEVLDGDDAARHAGLDAGELAKVHEEVALVEAAGEPFDLAAVRAGDMTPVFFGSAANNFGVQMLLDGFLTLSPPPRPQESAAGPVPPDDPRFSGFVFKIQSNMDPRHRDQIAFVRVCSGRFERDMKVVHSRTKESIRLSSSHKVLGRERETVDEAYAGDVIGVVGHSEFSVGDTLSQDPALVYHGVPRFVPEHFAWIHATNTAQGKRFDAGVAHLLQEGVLQRFTTPNASLRAPLLAAVGPLQFEVFRYRLSSEYGADSRLEEASWRLVRWLDAESLALAEKEYLTGKTTLARDPDGHAVLLFEKEWDCDYFADKHPKIRLARRPPAGR